MKPSLLLTLLAALPLGEFTPARADDSALKTRLALMRQQQPPQPRPPRYRAPAKETTVECPKPCPPGECPPRASKAKR